MFDRETMGRVAQMEISVFDLMMAEIMDEKEARLRKFERTHYVRNGKPMRKEKRKSYEKRKLYNCDFYRGFDTVRKYKQTIAEKSNAHDWELEQDNIADAEEQTKIAEEYAIYYGVQQKRYWDNMTEWLKYA